MTQDTKIQVHQLVEATSFCGPCTICGRHTDLAAVVAEAKMPGGGTTRVCEGCLEAGQDTIDALLREHAAELRDEAEKIESLVDRIDAPTVSERQAAERGEAVRPDLRRRRALEEHAAELCRWADEVEALVGRLDVPSFAAWQAADQAAREAARREGYRQYRSDGGEATSFLEWEMSRGPSIISIPEWERWLRTGEPTPPPPPPPPPIVEWRRYRDKGGVLTFVTWKNQWEKLCAIEAADQAAYEDDQREADQREFERYCLEWKMALAAVRAPDEAPPADNGEALVSTPVLLVRKHGYAVGATGGREDYMPHDVRARALLRNAWLEAFAMGQEDRSHCGAILFDDWKGNTPAARPMRDGSARIASAHGRAVSA